MVVIVFGLPGSGKSYFAEKLAGRLQAVYINSDKVRRRVIRDIEYSAAEKSTVYEQMLRIAQEAVEREHDDVVLDGTFCQGETRRQFKAGLEDDADLKLIEIKAREELIRQRLAVPREDSDADLGVYELIKAQWEPEEDDHLILWSQQDNLEEMVKVAMQYLNVVYDGSSHS